MDTRHQPFPVKAYRLLIEYASYLQSPALLLIRLAWGYEAYQAGTGHLHDIAGTIEQFRKWHVPLPTLSVYVAGTTEVVGGILLMLGLFTRGTAIPFTFNFLVAIATAGKERIGKAFATSGLVDGLTGIVDDTAFPFMVTGVLMLAFGPGKLSLDYLIGRYIRTRHCCGIIDGDEADEKNPGLRPAS